MSKDKVIDLTTLIDHLDMMIRIADGMARTQPYLPSIKKLRDAAKRELDRVTEILS